MNAKFFSIWLLAVFLITSVTVKGFAYNLSGASWPGAAATYYSTGGNSNSTFDSAFVDAMNSWNLLSNFIFTNAVGYKDPCWNPNINPTGPWFNGWEFRGDLCGTSFGGSTLAVNVSWSQGSTIIQAGTIFNTAFTWNVHNGPGANFDFRRVAAHELGHALGLSHDNTFSALMNTNYSQSIETPQLDDINGLRAIYGITTFSPHSMATGDLDGNGRSDVVFAFGAKLSIGIWLFMNNSGWVHLHNLSPEIITTGDMDGNGLDDVIVDFGDPFGIWVRMNNSGWVQLHNLSPEIITTGDMDGNGLDDVIVDFGDPFGIWVRMNNSGWVQLHNLSPEIITTGDMDGNGLNDVIIDFGDPFGIWIRMNNTLWTKT